MSNFQGGNFALQDVEEAGGVGAVHLGVVELERDAERCTEKSAAVPAPYQKRVVEDAAVHADSVPMTMLSARS